MSRRKEPVIPNDLLDQLLADGDAGTALAQGGLLDALKKALTERALNAEMDHHLAGEDGAGNARNGYGRKTVMTDTGKLAIDVPRDRQASFDPQLIAKYQRRFPGFDDKIVSMYARGMSTREITGHLGVFENLPASLLRRVLYEEDYACLVRRDHPATIQPPTPASFAAMSHITVQISGMGDSAVDLALSGAGLCRRIAARVPHFVTAVAIVAESDMVISLPERLAHRFATTWPVSCIPMPFPLPRIAKTMIWHERRQDDPLHRWLRDQVVRAAGSVTR